MVTVLPPEAITLQEAEPIRMLQIDVSCPDTQSLRPSPASDSLATLASTSLCPRVLPSLSSFPLSLPLALEHPLGFLDPALWHASQTHSPGSTFFLEMELSSLSLFFLL